jgi:hypothetical protein
MGRMNLESMLAYGTEDQALAYHCASNCYPPIHSAFIPGFKQAIARARDGEWDTEIELPNGTRTVAWIIERAHLEAFVESDE